MIRATLDRARDFGVLSPPSSRARFVQDHKQFDQSGVEIFDNEIFNVTPGESDQPTLEETPPPAKLVGAAEQFFGPTGAAASKTTLKLKK